jgi:peptidyl-prolyl cis-trans isomerase A (cyclophilin A)
MNESSFAAPPHRAGRCTRRNAVSGLTALGIALAAGRSGAMDVGADSVCHVVIETALGSIGVLLELGRAPISAGDFLKYVDRGLYAGGAFYRTVRPDDDPDQIKIDVVQGGLTDESGFLAPITHESTNLTGLRHRNGTISIARGEVGTGTAGAFFICIGDQPQLDFGGKRNPDRQGFAAFGHVTSAMDLVCKIWALKTQGPAGSPDGELIASPVQIFGAHRV